RLLPQPGAFHDLGLALDRARPRDHHELVPATDDAADLHRLVDPSIGWSLLRRALVGPRDRDQLLDPRELLDLADGERGDVPVHADEGDLRADHLAGLEAEPVELLLDGRVLGGAVAPGVQALGLSSQPGTAVVWETATARPVHPALSWQDGRTAERCRTLLAEGVFVSPLTAATKIEWILDRVDPERDGVRA